MRILPPGSMRMQRRIGRAEGVAVTLALTLTIGAAVVAAMPSELYRSAPSTVHPVPQPASAAPGFVDTPPCTDMGAKDCVGIAESPRPDAPYFDHLPWRDLPSRTVSSPGTLLLIVAAGLAWLVAGLAVAKAVGINEYEDDDERQ